jgi:hypothetical protein
MSIEQPMISQKQLRAEIRKLKIKYPGVIAYGEDSPFFQEVMTLLGEQPVFILHEIIGKNIKDVMDADATFDFSANQLDFIGYGDKWIKLPEERTVQVKKAALEHLLHQDKVLIKEHTKQMKAFIAHRELLVPLIETMQEHHLTTAGEAINLLNKKI